MPAAQQVTITKKEVKEALQDKFDKVTFHKDGAITVKKSFFYTHGNSSEKVAAKVEAMFPGLVQVEENYDDWKPWPKTSYFVVKFRVRGMGV